MSSDKSLMRVHFSITSGFDIADIDDIVSCVDPGAFGDVRSEAAHQYVDIEETNNGVVLEFITTNVNDLQTSILQWTSRNGVSPPELW